MILKSVLYTSEIKLMRKILLFVLIICFCIHCASKQEKEDFVKPAKDTAANLFKNIEELNSKSPDFYSADFDVEGIVNGKKFKSTGEITYNKAPKKAKIVFQDAIFKSPLTIITIDADIVRLYFPLDRILYIDNIQTIDTANYSDIKINIDIIKLTEGIIPLITKYMVKESLSKDSAVNDNVYIILENDILYQTISFKENIPDKILWVDKNTKDKLEVYLENQVKNREFLLFKSIRLVNPGYNISLKFKNINFDTLKDIESITRLDLPKDSKVVYIK